MLTSLTVAMVLAFTPDASRFQGVLLNASDAASPLKLSVPSLRGVDISADKAEFFTTHFATQMTRLGVKVTTQQEIQALLAEQRQKQMLGCDEKTADKCMTEIANALGADGIVIGSIANISGAFALNLKVIDAVDGQTLALYTAEAENERSVLEMLSEAAKDVAQQLRRARTAATAAAANPNAPAVHKEGPTSIRYVKREGPVTKWGGRLMIGSGVLLGLSLGSFVLAFAIADGASDLAGALLLLGLAEGALAVPLFFVGLAMAIGGKDEVVQVRADYLPPVDPVRSAPPRMYALFRFDLGPL